jgi:hypothetical protein
MYRNVHAHTRLTSGDVTAMGLYQSRGVREAQSLGVPCRDLETRWAHAERALRAHCANTPRTPPSHGDEGEEIVHAHRKAGSHGHRCSTQTKMLTISMTCELLIGQPNMGTCYGKTRGSYQRTLKPRGHGNVEGYEGSQSQACPAETYRPAEIISELALGAHCANTPRTPLFMMNKGEGIVRAVAKAMEEAARLRISSIFRNNIKYLRKLMIR